MSKKKPKNKKNGKPIKENYSFKEIDKAFEDLGGLQELYLMGKQFGYNDSQLEEIFHQFEENFKQYKSLKIIPDKFNHYFAKKGWIAFETLDFSLMKRCVQLAEQGMSDEAESALIEYFTNKEKVSFLIKRIMYLKEFSPRRTLMTNALEDHFSGRYHASVPLFLMMIDGLVNDFENVGFFAESVELTVWDTIAAHDSGLGTIAKIFGRSRTKTTDEEIVLPFRNGILHGRDLGYANVQVSSKALSTLLALRDWADAIKDGKKGISKEFVPPTTEEALSEVTSLIEQLQENYNAREFMDSWVGRDLKVGKNFPEKGEASEYNKNTPERALIEFIYFMREHNFGNMAKMISNSYLKGTTIGKVAGELRKIFIEFKLIDFKLVNVFDTAPVISEIEMLLEFKQKEKESSFEVLHKFRLCYEDEAGDPVAWGYKNAEWKILRETIRDLEFSHLKLNSI